MAMAANDRKRALHSLALLLIAAGLLLLARSGWNLLRFAAFQHNASMFDLAAGNKRPASNLSLPALAHESREMRILGRLEVPRLRMSVLVADGDDDDTLSLAAGHVPGTALPGSVGNVVIAGHRDIAFRALRRIRRGDVVRIRSGRDYEYVVEDLRIVTPDNASVLRESGGSTLTLITCFPFGYIGPAPKRYVVRAELIATT